MCLWCACLVPGGSLWCACRVPGGSLRCARGVAQRYYPEAEKLSQKEVLAEFERKMAQAASGVESVALKAVDEQLQALIHPK